MISIKKRNFTNVLKITALIKEIALPLENSRQIAFHYIK
jgi:hypothetical protein